MDPIRTRVPVRIDLAGGTLDVGPLPFCLAEPGVTVNAALDLPVEVAVRPHDDATIRLASADQGEEAVFDGLDALVEALAERPPPRLELLLRAVATVRPAAGFSLFANAQVPVGSGLGGSSALLVAVLVALLRATGAEPEPARIARIAQDVETQLLRTPTGYQDYYPPLLGGCLALEARPGGAKAERLPVDLDRLARRLRLVDTGAAHVSGLTNWGVVKAFLDGDARTVASLEEIAAAARTVREALRAEDVDAAFEAVAEEGRLRQRMAPGVATPALHDLDAGVRQAGAIGTKVQGAGGGGCVLVLLRGDDSDDEVDRAIQRSALARIPVRLRAEGASVEPLPPSIL